jgi:succinyl-diaminopimelate desuccinylase
MIKQRLQDVLAKLVSYPSITPEDKGTQTWMRTELEKIGFVCTDLPKNRVSNFYAELGHDGPCLAFAGHTDVVTIGDPDAWERPPFNLSEKDNYYIGRGVADMKGAIAAFMVACESFLAENKAFKGKIAWLITSAEEGDDYLDGTPHIMSHLAKHDLKPDYCIVGEPSAKEKVGDLIRVGRRGSLSGYLTLHGIQGHVAYPDQADNPIHHAQPFIDELIQTEWDQGNEHFPKTTLQISYINAGEAAAGNVIPGDLTIHFNLRYSTEISAEDIQQTVINLLDKHVLNYTLDWKHSGEPFLTENSRLISAVTDSIEACFGYQPEQSTGGGTSDGRFIAPHGVEVIELGLCNETIHKVNERIEIDSLEALHDVYVKILTYLFLD